MNPTRQTLPVVAAVFLGTWGGLTTNLNAAAITWGNTGTDFNADGGWVGSMAPGTGDVATFAGVANASYQPAASAGISIGGLDFTTTDAYGYTLSGSAITLMNTATAAGSAAITTRNTTGTNTIAADLVLGAAAGSVQAFTQTSTGTLVLGGVISGGASSSVLSLAGSSGTFRINGANSYLGTTSVASAVVIGNKAAFSSGTIKMVSGAKLLAGTDLGGANKITNNLLAGGNFTILDGGYALEFGGNLDLGGVARSITVGGKTAATAPVLSGVISNDGGAGLSFARAGTSGDRRIVITGTQNSYTGITTVGNADLSITRFGNIGELSSIGTNSVIAVGNNASSQGGALRYIGAGETTNKTIKFGTGSGGITFDTTGATGGLTLTADMALSGTTASLFLTLSGDSAGNVFAGKIIESTSASTVNPTNITKNGVGAWTLSGSNSYTGSITVNGGVLQFGSVNSLSTGTARNITVNAGATAALGYAMDQAFLGRVAAGSAGTLALAADSANNLDFSAAGANLTAASLGAVGNATYSGTLTPNGTSYRLGGGGGTLTMNTTLTGDGNSLTVAGSGVVVLSSAANSYTAATTVKEGVLSVGKLANGGVNSGIGASTSAASMLILGSTTTGTLRYTGAGDSTDRLFTLGLAGGALDASGSGAIDFTATGALAFIAPTTSARSLTLTGANTGDNRLSAQIKDAGGVGGATSVVKSGSGQWILAGANTYSGITTVSAGTLKAGSTSAFGTSAISLAGGVLDLRDFNVGNAITITGSGARVLLQTSTGALTTNFAAGSSFRGWQRGSTGVIGVTTASLLSGTAASAAALNSSWTNDAHGSGAVVSDVLDLAGTGAGNPFVLQLSYTDDAYDTTAMLGYWKDNTSWVNAIYGGGYTGGGLFVDGAYDGSLALGTWGRDAATNTVWAVVDHNSEFAVVVPEPAMFALLGLGGLALLRRRKA